VRTMHQFMVFVGVGVTSAIIDVGLMQGLLLVRLHYLAAATVGFAAGLVANFALHTRVTFSTPYSHSVLVRFMTVVLANYLITIIFVSLFNDWLTMPILGKIASLPVVAVNGFLLSKHWVFK
jgi:putative flippase GtrA